MNTFGGILMIVGTVFTMIGGIGVVRFSDLMSRVHAAAKAPTLGLILVAGGVAIEIGSMKAFVTLTLVVVLQLLTSPVATHVLARASYGQVDSALDGEDDLAAYVASISDPAPTVPGDAADDDEPGHDEPDHDDCAGGSTADIDPAGDR